MGSLRIHEKCTKNNRATDQIAPFPSHCPGNGPIDQQTVYILSKSVCIHHNVVPNNNKLEGRNKHSISSLRCTNVYYIRENCLKWCLVLPLRGRRVRETIINKGAENNIVYWWKYFGVVCTPQNKLAALCANFCHSAEMCLVAQIQVTVVTVTWPCVYSRRTSNAKIFHCVCVCVCVCVSGVITRNTWALSLHCLRWTVIRTLYYAAPVTI